MSNRWIFVPAVVCIVLGTVLHQFRVTDADRGDHITVTIADQATRLLVSINQTGSGNNVTVDIILIKELDREESSSRPLNFTAMDDAGNAQPILFTIYLTDVNDHSPAFQNEPYTIAIKEDANLGSIVPNINVTATDPDNGDAGHVTYSMEANSQSQTTKADYMATFGLDKNTGRITLKRELDYETNMYYQFRVYAQDDGTPKLTSTTNLIIRILDVQDTPPFFTGIPYRRTIDENVESNYSVITAAARDGDSGVSNNLTYSIEEGDCSKLFNISQEGEIHVANAIDRDSGVIKEKRGDCSFPVKVSEINGTHEQYGNSTTTTNVTVTIRDLNDNSPHFNQSRYYATVQENTPQNVPITINTTITVHDKDEGENAKMAITLMYPNNTTCSDFKPNPAVVMEMGTVMIMVQNNTILDYEARQNITFLVVATEVANQSHVATATVVLDLIDMNDNSPQFENQTYEIHIMENTANGTYIKTITATDKDSGSNGNISYTIFGGQDRFRVNKYDGNIATYCTSCDDQLDREKVPVFYMTYTATDGHGRSNAASLVVHLDDDNDNAPVFRSDSYYKLIAENDDTYVNTSFVTVQASDADELNTTNSEIQYNIFDVSDQSMTSNISINNVTGQMYLVSPIDFEKLNGWEILLTVVATDLGNTSMSSKTTVTVTVEDKNDQIPNFTQSSFATSVDENVTSEINNYSHVGNVHAVDNDGTERNNKFNYFITAGGFGKFTINSTNGEVSVQVNAKLDRETMPLYNITINTIDQGSPPLTSTATLYVTINDVNDECPRFNHTVYESSVRENVSEEIGMNIITAYATDVDSSSNLSYTIIDHAATDENGHDVNSTLIDNFFRIHEDNGTVYIASITDRETAADIRLTVKVQDMDAYGSAQNATETNRRNVTNGPPNIAAMVVIHLLDINDNSPEFSQSEYCVNVSEAAINGVDLTTIEATDRDVNRTIKYKLISGLPPTSSFAIDPDKGILKKIGNIDREANETIILTIKATDNGVPPLNTTVDVTVSVLDANDNAPAIDAHNGTYYVPENATAGTEVVMITARDKDIGANKNITFHISSGDMGNFTINETTGEITVSNNLDREKTATYTLTVVAMDNPVRHDDQKSSQITVIVHIVDINDNPPVFNKPLYEASILENYGVLKSIAQVIAKDKDKAQTNQSEITYSIFNTTTNASLFKIHGTSGIVSINKSLVGYVGTYLLTIMAQDHGVQPLNATTTLNITVSDVNLNNPVLGNIPHNSTIRIYECARPYTPLWQFNATDADHGINKETEFWITGLDGNITDLKMDSTNGSLYTVNRLSVLKKETYMFQVNVKDKGKPPRISMSPPTITVQVIDVDDHIPSFTNADCNFAVLENKVQTVGKVTAVDEDKNSQSCYKIEDGAWSNNFTVSKFGGIIMTSIELDREHVSLVVLNVTVRDCPGTKSTHDVCDNITIVQDNSVNTSINVTVTVTDVDDNAPQFVFKQITTGMRRNTDQGTALELKLKDAAYVTDQDTPANGYNKWRFGINGQITVSDGLQGVVGPLGGSLPCDDGLPHVFCVTGNGSIVNNKWYTDDNNGYFLLPVIVSDDAGNDTVVVKIFLIGDSQVLIMTLFGSKNNTASKKKNILESFSNVTGYEFVYDSIKDHKTSDNQVNTYMTDLHFHVVDPSTDRVLNADEVKRLVDRNVGALASVRSTYQIGDILASTEKVTEEDTSEKAFYILIAVIVVLGVTIMVIVYVSVVSHSKQKRKFKAATATTMDKRDLEKKESNAFVPGSNQYSKQSNPLLNADVRETKLPLDIVDCDDLDENTVDGPSEQTLYDTLEEREVTMDMYTEDRFVVSPEQNPLDAALRQYEISKPTGYLNMSDVSPEHVAINGFVNTAYNEFEMETADI